MVLLTESMWLGYYEFTDVCKVGTKQMGFQLLHYVFKGAGTLSLPI